MKFNAKKFELLRYGKEQEIKSATTYESYDDSNIDDKEQVRDLGGMSVLSPCRLGKVGCLYSHYAGLSLQLTETVGRLCREDVK